MRSFSISLVALSVAMAHSAHADTVNLDELVVSASGYEQNTQDAAASITVISAEEIEKKAYRDVTDALAAVPGVYVSGGGSTSDITMRGLGGKYTMILVDGKRQTSRETRPNSDGPGIEQGWIPPLSAIERIEVIRGPMSSLYGSDALGGVINIITKDVQPEWHGQLSLGTVIQEDNASGNSMQTDFYASGPLVGDTLGLEVFGQINEREEDSITNGYAEQSMQNLTSKLSWKVNDEQTLKFEAGTESQNRDRTAGLSATSDSEAEYQRDHFSISSDLNKENSQHNSYISYENNDNKARDMQYESLVLNHQSHLFFDQHTLTVGGQFENQTLSDDSNNADNGLNELERWQAAVFAEDEFYLTDTFSLTAGLRYNEDENYGSAVTPRVYGVWQTTDNITLKGGISAGYRSPDLRQATDGWAQTTGRGSAIILGNSDLEAEKSINHEVGIAWTNHQGTKAELTAFYTEFKDKITESRDCDTSAGDASCTYDGESYSFISSRYNVDKVVTQGVEASFAMPLTATLDWDVGYTFTDSEQKSGDFAGQPLNRIPKHRIHTNLSWDATEALNVWGEVNYVGETTEGLSRTSMAEAYPEYTLVDTGFTYKATKDVTFYAGIYNLLDKEIDYDTYGKILDGRRYQAKVKVAF
ncbi:MAG: ligand-gated channel protein [Marinomonas sp.]|uniref:Outer membrane receptor for ferrienterochelin and colicins n=1 Tax=Marinomonas communis TaxID=28254 RepID=A0A4V3DG27_9GAMM|nr:TonB-dependent receptor [Marinomonas communis]MCC4275668.1 TonB-dependent receptor [Marinomonas communis]RUM51147.1 MAG: ligand-gated channel protein [Marinomonas sp.]TDR12681.1 outer membrane receptor for ferrienterochelin and colicins [Marinomonas communis]